MDKNIKVIFKEDESTAYVYEKMSRCDYGQILQVEGLTLPDGNIEVDFSLTECEGEASTFIGQVKDNIITVDIPDFIFQKESTYNLSTYDAYAFIYQTDEDSGRTIKKIVFTIQARPKKTTNVPEDQKDQFLEEVRKVMQETKDIAQSVRDDADAGVFDGEQGPKGDAGAVDCRPVDELPTTDIVPSRIYLVKNGTEEVEVNGEKIVKNKYTEYMYIDGEWEIIGSVSIGMNLSDYVKKDDFATADKAGLVQMAKWNSYGLYMANDGKIIAISKATNDEIDEKASGFKPIVPSNLDYAVMKALSDSKLEWTEEQKQLARALLGSVGSGDYPVPNGVSGLLKIISNLGFDIAPDGALRLGNASNQGIDNRANRYNAGFGAITPFNLDYAVKKALSDCKLSGDDAWTDGEMKLARELFGIDLRHNQARAWTAVQRGANGVVLVGEPTEVSHATTKKYVDDRVGSVESILTELKAHAESLIGGEA